MLKNQKNWQNQVFIKFKIRISKELVIKNFNMYLNPQNFDQKLNKEEIEMEPQNCEISCEKSEELPAKPSEIQKRPQKIQDSKPSCFQCSDCGSTFTKQSNLRMHTEIVHEKKKPWLCSECGNSFGKQDCLKRHISIVHKG